jgi:hypothetical protein
MKLSLRLCIAVFFAIVFMSPAIVCNILPHMHDVVQDGHLVPRAAGVAIFYLASVIAMAGMPFAKPRITALSDKAAALVLTVVLIGLNFANALDVGDHLVDALTSGPRTVLAKAAAINGDIDRLERQKAALTPHDSVSDESVNGECKNGHGQKCRALMTARDLTKEQAGIEAKIGEKREEFARLGALPKHTDATAAGFVRIYGLFAPAPKNADETVSEWRPIVFAAGVELLGSRGPVLIFAAFGIVLVGARKEESRTVEPVAPPAPQIPLAALSPAEVAKAVSEAPAPAKAKKPRTKKTASKTGDVKEWFEERTCAALGGSVQCGIAHADYVGWCRSRGLKPLSLNGRFGTTMKNLKVNKEKRSGYVYYVGIVLTERPALGERPALKVVSG